MPLNDQRRNAVLRPSPVIAVVLLSSNAYGRFPLSARPNIDRQPIWGPTGYGHVKYSVLTDIDLGDNWSREREQPAAHDNGNQGQVER
jgi:hypothetical protein